MALVLKDRVQVTSTTVGTGTFTLDSAVAGFQDFSVIGDGNTTYYVIANGTDWEVGLGTYTASGTTLSRDSILESSNSGSAVDWGAGIKNVFVTYPAERSVYTEGGVLASGLPTFFVTPSSANLATVITDETGTGALVFANTPTLVTPVLGTPTSGTLSNCTVDGTVPVGFLSIPQNSRSAAYTLVAGDAGKYILHPSADTTARTFTIPANGSVPFPIGTAITFVNQNGAGVVTIAITTDTMRLAGAGTTGSRTLAANGIATAIKLTSTEWIISGTGLT
jgi:hypothetical protein